MDPVPFLKICSLSDKSLLATWKHPNTILISAYVLEWEALYGANANHVSFEIVDKNQSSFVASGTVKMIVQVFSLSLSECLLYYKC